MTLPTTNFQRHFYQADDDEDDRAIFLDALTEIDDTVILIQARDGNELMEMLAVPPKVLPEVILLDINMPKKDGFECLREIRAREDLKDLNVIMFSTCSNPVTIAKAQQLGASFYAVKPSSYNDLKTFIGDILQTDWNASEIETKKFRLI